MVQINSLILGRGVVAGCVQQQQQLAAAASIDGWMRSSVRLSSRRLLLAGNLCCAENHSFCGGKVEWMRATDYFGGK